MAKEYIERSFVEYVVNYFGGMLTWSKEDVLSEIKRVLANEPAADVVEVVRCKYCRFYRNGEELHYCQQTLCRVEETDFCSCGERKDNG